MVLGNYYLTLEIAGLEHEGKAYKNSNEARRTFNTTNTLYPHRSEMEAERINQIEASIDDLTRRLNELRGYL